MGEVFELLNDCYERLQTLQGVPPTRHNLEIILQTLYDLRHINEKLKEGSQDGRTEIDPT